MIRRPLLLLAMLATVFPAQAEVVPVPGPGDPHIQTVGYDPQQVVALRVAPGFAVTLLFSPDERIETVTVGDSGNWQVQPNRRADRLVVKPVGYPAPTNLTAITDQRVYNFTLYGASSGDGALPYTVSFLYPPPLTDEAPAQAIETGRYRLKGDAAPRPSAISDDGAFTQIQWPQDMALPAVYAQGLRGKLALVNGVMRDGAYVIEGVYPRLVFILGKARATATRIEMEGAR